jgi:hypothetical protein
MQTITQETNATLMAQWLATGGALDAATTPTYDVRCQWGDPRLTACGPTQSYHSCQRVDDGLAATQLSQPYPAGYCAEDDRLARPPLPTASPCP